MSDQQHRTTVVAMKSDIATRLASTVVAGVSVDDADAIIREFLVQISRCPACDDTGSLIVACEVSFPTKLHGEAVLGAYIEAGTPGPCPRCGGLDNGRARHDPEFVVWHCFSGLAERECQHVKHDPTLIASEHAPCGYRVVLPVPPASIPGQLS